MKTLHVSLGTHQKSQQKALEAVSSEYEMIDWTSISDVVELQQLIRNKADGKDFIFFQLQKRLFNPQFIESLPGFKVNWTGDVRDPIPKWMFESARAFDVTAFSNQRDVNEFKKQGLTSEYLDIGFEESIYNSDGPSKQIDKPVVFFANNYPDRFPNSKYREMIVKGVPKISVIGSGWGSKAYGDFNHNPQVEAEIYRGAKIAINISHFTIDRYTSDRLYRALACGCMVLTHNFPGLAKIANPGEHLVAFKDITELRRKIKFYLENEDIRSEIAEEGLKLAFKRHTWLKKITNFTSLMQAKYGLCNDD